MEVIAKLVEWIEFYFYNTNTLGDARSIKLIIIENKHFLFHIVGCVPFEKVTHPTILPQAMGK